MHLNVPWRAPLGPEPRPGEVGARSSLALEGRDGERPLTTVPAPPLPAAEPLVEALAGQLGSKPRGLIVAGRMPVPGAAEAIAGLARAAGYPILAEPTSQLRFGRHDRDLLVAAYEPIARARPSALEPELVVRFGELPTCKPLRQWLADLPQAAQIAVDPAHGWHEPTRIAGAIARADPEALARALAARLAHDARDTAWRDSWLSAGRAAAGAIESELASIGRPTEPGLQATLGRLYRDGELVYTASSMPIRDQEAFLGSSAAEVLFLANRGANGIDGLVSSGIGAAAASGRPTVIVTGDLGLLHDLGGLAALADVATPVRVVVVHNDGGAIFSFLPQASELGADEFEALLATPRRVDVERAASLFGLPHRRVDDLASLDEALAAGTGLIEVPVERSGNVELHRRLSGAAEAALAQP